MDVVVGDAREPFLGDLVSEAVAQGFAANELVIVHLGSRFPSERAAGILRAPADPAVAGKEK